MKKLITDAIWSILAFFAILSAVSYFTTGSAGLTRLLTDPVNWIIIIVVIASSYALRRYRSGGENPT